MGTQGNGPTHLIPIPSPMAQRPAFFLPCEGLRYEVSLQERVLSLLHQKLPDRQGRIHSSLATLPGYT